MSEVAEAYLAGLEHLVARGGDPSKVASVASFFVSRIDTAVDKLIDARADQAPAGQREALVQLRGKVAIANAKLAYQRYKRLFAGARWEKLRARARGCSGCFGRAPAPRTRPTATFSMWTS